ncbi:MAG: terminase small subunit, partial [Alphaproteobacteria bacterium]|nr:terminase small subunit [Alphaproteobacteria bacterium]
ATVTFDKVRTEREGYQAALTKIELDRQRGLLVEKAGVERQAFEAARLLRDRLLALVPQIAGELASMTDERDIAVLLRDRIKSVLMETSQDVRVGGADLPE